MKHSFFLPALGLAALTTVAVMTVAVAPALATTGTQFEAVRGRNERIDGRRIHVSGIWRRSAVVIGAGLAMALASARDNRISASDGRLELHLDPTHWINGRAGPTRLRDLR